MKTKFMSYDTKHQLFQALKQDEQLQRLAMNEIDRLEGIIKDYEIVIQMMVDKFSMEKKPKDLL